MSQIRVLQVLDLVSHNSGVSSVVMNYYNSIDKNKVIFDFMVNEPIRDDLKVKLEEQGSRIYLMPKLQIKNVKKYIKALNSFFYEHQEYNIVHGHVPNAACFYLRAAKKNGVPVRILHGHSSRGSNHLIKRLRNFLLNKAGMKYANSYFSCSKIAANYLFGEKNMKVNKIYYQHNAIKIDKFQYNEQVRNNIRSQMDIKDEFVVGHVGRFSSEKNHLQLLEIFSEVVKINPQSKLLLIGGGELETEIRKKVSALKLENHVIFAGVQANVNEYMQAMDVFVLPSQFEGLPVVCIEAQASGLPCVISETVTRETNISGTVRYVNKENINEWVQEIMNQAHSERKSNQQKLITSGYSIEQEANKLCARYMSELQKVGKQR